MTVRVTVMVSVRLMSSVNLICPMEVSAIASFSSCSLVTSRVLMIQ